MPRDYKQIAIDITSKGFFSEYLPPCFRFPDEAFNDRPEKKCDAIAPYSFTMSRHNGNNARRTIFIPESGSYVAVYYYMLENNMFQELIEFTESCSHSFSPILWNDDSIVFHEQAYGDVVSGDSTVSSYYINNIGKKIIQASGAKKILKMDISNCYSSFYMHMIPAIMLGVDGAEENYNKSIRKISGVDPRYKKYKKLDEVIRRQNLNRTNGLLTGPLLSKIIAEAILTRIDKDLEEQNLNFVRYVDDYEVFVYGNDEREVISIFENTLKKYGFSLNSEKTEIIDFPYYIVENFEKVLNVLSVNPIGRADTIEIFNTFFEFEKKGTNGAIRYLLKRFEENEPEFEDPELYKAYLITIMANNERSLVKSCSILINQKEKYALSDIDVEKITGLLLDHIEFQHDLEVIWILYLLIENGKIEIEKGVHIINKIVKSNNELAHIMLLNKDLLDEDNLSIIKGKAKSWILLYELFVNDKISEDDFKSRLNLDRNLIYYKKLQEKKVHFVSL